MKAKIFNISRSSLHDGNGIRTVVYFKGCTLKCMWCHNPEGLSTNNNIVFHSSRCIKCGRCIEICSDCHKIENDTIVFERNNCTYCGKCAKACPNGALVTSHKEMTVEEIMQEIRKDKAFYERTNGGVTFSGGECLMYPEFLCELLKRCKEEKINTAVESAFNVSWENINRVKEYIDMFIVDIKHADSDVHKKYTGVGNNLILENIEKISNEHDNVMIRVPVIPTVNDNNLKEIAKIILKLGDGIKKVELLKYNNMAENKYNALDMQPNIFAAKPQSDEQMESFCNDMRSVLGEQVSISF